MNLSIIPASEGLGPEADRFKDFPAPREMLSLIGHREAETEILDTLRSGRMHHAWLIAGEEGIGKATFAYRIARFLLAHPVRRDFSGFRSLAVAADATVAHQVAAGGHPDLAVIRRTLNDRRTGLLTEIGAGVVRKSLDIFNKTAAAGGYRIAIVDCCDELNAHSANALLKTLEEPPANSLFLLVAHRLGAVLPTIRSRCRLIRLNPLSETDIVRGLAAMPGVEGASDAARSFAARESAGSLRRALALLDPAILAFVDSARTMLDALPHIDPAKADALAGELAGKAGEENFEQFCDLAERWMEARLHSAKGVDIGALAAEHAVLTERRRSVETYNLDRRPFAFATLAGLAGAFRT